jgi:hypothetical protein
MATGTIAAIGLGTTLASSGVSFYQAEQNKKKQREADMAAEKALNEAKAKLDINYYEKLGIQKEPYNLQRQALLASGQEALQAGVESERGAAAVAGRIQMAQNESMAGISTAMGQDLTELNKLVAGEDIRLNQQKIGLDLQEVQGAQLASQNYQEMAAASNTAAVQGLVSAGGQMVDMSSLYGNSLGPGEAEFNAAKKANTLPPQYANLKYKDVAPTLYNNPDFLAGRYDVVFSRKLVPQGTFEPIGGEKFKYNDAPLIPNEIKLNKKLG